MAQTFVQIGNSHGVIISKTLLKEMGVNPKQEIWIETDKENGAFIIHTKGKDKRKTVSSSRLFAILEKVNKEYGPALKKLATI